MPHATSQNRMGKPPEASTRHYTESTMRASKARMNRNKERCPPPSVVSIQTSVPSRQSVPQDNSRSIREAALRKLLGDTEESPTTIKSPCTKAKSDGNESAQYLAGSVSPTKADVFPSKKSSDFQASARSMSMYSAGGGGICNMYSGVTLSDITGSLTLSADRLLFKPRHKRDRDHIFEWQLESLQKHQISAVGTDPHLLKLTSQGNPPKAVIMTFPDRASLESVHANLSSTLQPLRKYRKLEETLAATQRKLKDANKAIDEMQDANEKLLASCEAFAKKCKSLSERLEQQQREEIISCLATEKVAELQQQLLAVRPEIETLRNEKIAMTIAHEMDLDTCQARITFLEKELKEERAAFARERAAQEKQLEDRHANDEVLHLQLEVHVLAKELLSERKATKEVKAKAEEQEREADDMLWKVRRERNNAYLEVAHLKQERGKLGQQVREYEKEIIEVTKQEESEMQTKPCADNEDTSLFGLECLSAYTMDEPTGALTKSKSKTLPSQLPWAALSLPVLFGAQAPFRGLQPDPPWLRYPVVMQWRGVLRSPFAPPCSFNSAGVGDYVKATETQLGHITFTPNDSGVAVLVAMDGNSNDRWARCPATTLLTSLHGGNCLAGAAGMHTIRQYPTEGPIVELSRHVAGQLQHEEYAGSGHSTLWAWSRFGGVPNRVVSIETQALTSCWDQDCFIDPLAASAPWWGYQPRPRLPDNTLVLGEWNHQDLTFTARDLFTSPRSEPDP